MYHSLAKNSGKKVLRVIDHSTIYFLIAGSYAPFSLILMKDVPLWGISNFPSAGIVIICLCYALIILGAVFTAINFEKFNLLSQLMYAIGGSIVLIDPVTFLKALSINTLGLVSFIVGSVLYFVGLAFYNVGKKKSLWWHTVFHFFILCGILGHFLSIYFSVII